MSIVLVKFYAILSIEKVKTPLILSITKVKFAAKVLLFFELCKLFEKKIVILITKETILRTTKRPDLAMMKTRRWREFLPKMSARAYIQHTFSIYSAYIGTSGQVREKYEAGETKKSYIIDGIPKWIDGIPKGGPNT